MEELKMKKKSLLLVPMCLALLSGCSNISIRYYDSVNNETTEQNTLETFFDNSITTYTDNQTTKTLETLYETCKKSVVTIQTYVTYTSRWGQVTSGLYSSGSGFIIAETENYLYIYNNAHVITVSESVDSVEVEAILSDYSRYSVTIIASDSQEDVAVIRIDKPDSSHYLVAALGDSDTINPGESVFAIGSPLGIDYASTITSGIISGKNVTTGNSSNSDGRDSSSYLLQTDAAINPGNSGGPLFNYNGEVIGVNSLKILQSSSGVDIEGIGFAIPINHFKIVANTIINGETYIRPKIGITASSVANLSITTREKYGITIQNGIYVSEVSNTTITQLKGKIITHINNQYIYNYTDFASELYNHKPGEQIEITYCDVNGSNPATLTITLI